MPRDMLASNWEKIRAQVQDRWTRLTRDEINSVGGNYDRLSGLLQDKYGRFKEDANAEINGWLNEILGKPPQNMQDDR